MARVSQAASSQRQSRRGSFPTFSKLAHPCRSSSRSCSVQIFSNLCCRTSPSSFGAIVFPGRSLLVLTEGTHSLTIFAAPSRTSHELIHLTPIVHLPWLPVWRLFRFPSTKSSRGVAHCGLTLKLTIVLLHHCGRDLARLASGAQNPADADNSDTVGYLPFFLSSRGPAHVLSPTSTSKLLPFWRLELSCRVMPCHAMSHA